MPTTTPPFRHLPPAPPVDPSLGRTSGPGAGTVIVILLALGALGLVVAAPILFLMLMSVNPGC